MKKVVAILGMFIILIAVAAGAYYLGTQSNPPPVIEEPTSAAGNEPTSAADDAPPAYEEMLVGLWIDSPVVGSGIGECYRFYEDGTFTFTPSDMIADPETYKPFSAKGTYQVEGDYVILLMTESTAVEGGTWAEDPIVGYVLEGGTEKTTVYPEPKEIYAQYLGVFFDLPKEMFSFNGMVYWKTSGDPDMYLD